MKTPHKHHYFPNRVENLFIAIVRPRAPSLLSGNPDLQIDCLDYCSLQIDMDPAAVGRCERLLPLCQESRSNKLPSGRLVETDWKYPPQWLYGAKSSKSSLSSQLIVVDLLSRAKVLRAVLVWTTRGKHISTPYRKAATMRFGILLLKIWDHHQGYRDKRKLKTECPMNNHQGFQLICTCAWLAYYMQHSYFCFPSSSSGEFIFCCSLGPAGSCWIPLSHLKVSSF